MTLTPNERLEAYKYALEDVEKMDNGICLALLEWLSKEKKRSDFELLSEIMFPEFYDKRPDERFIFWWPRYSPLRILALEHCILEVGMRIEFEKENKK